jgi:muramidase (phage lysozyme)
LTFAELDQLEEAYGAEVQETNPDQGVFATPMGRYQIVGTTRRELAQQMGLPPTTKFTPQVQDLMFERLVGRRRQQAMNSDLTFEQALQLEWPGLTRG